MRSSTIDERFQRFIEEPTRHSYLRVREKLMEQPQFDPYSDDLRFLELHFKNGEFEHVLREAAPLRSIWRLSPRFHYFLGISALETGNLELAEDEKTLSRACLYGLTDTGEGTAEEPFLVTYLSDEYDVIQCLGVEVRQQQVVDVDGRQLDVLRDLDGKEHWFDVTEVMDVARRKSTVMTADQTPRPIARQA